MTQDKNKKLGLAELIAIALGGMVGGGIFTILGVSVSLIGNLTPIAIIIGGLIASLAAYSYVKLGLYYQDEGATYSFYKKTYPNSRFLASAIGWFIIFGYISTLALYAYTFSSYAISSTDFADNDWIRKIVAIAIIGVFALINIWSVNGMGKIEDLMVYTKLLILTIISIVLMQHGTTDFGTFIDNMALDAQSSSIFSIMIVASITFVAYEGFQLVINAVNEMNNPEKNIPRAIYSAITLAILIYVVISIGALFAIPTEDIIKNKEYALAAGAGKILGNLGTYLVIAGALLASSSAISGTVFGASRQMSVIAKDGYFPNWLSIRKKNSPQNAIIGMAVMSSILILGGGLELILEFGSITFLLVSLLMAIANFKIRDKTNSSKFLTALSIAGLSSGGLFILYYEFTNKWEQMLAILILYVILGIGAWIYSKKVERKEKNI
ncbi:amino acid transporter [Bernardetia litoralis DSM 6794]|uniref:Amino acid transporter n=1 Tax=Bernardetia litoralis (strain ATCC 23117 / DSM 6794 / NBRC 15988 / NCIMB 1366 / Fx l1 / Sio-4) TaxID=880071 RepID=I4ALK1_BERLS|nr:APC family permease [Bernardetia litoralis]AFM04836.1 amino acid transporter [Bernardetia litoralis DSM 6794]